MSSALVIFRNLQGAFDRAQAQTFDKILFAPTFASEVQRAQLTILWESLSPCLPGAQWVETSTLNGHLAGMDEIEVAGWDCADERAQLRGLGGRIQFLRQNRLFQKRGVGHLQSFSQFRNEVEKELRRSSIEPGSSPYDARVKAHLEDYFYGRHLAKTYFDTRNGLLKPEDSTRFSMDLSWGTLDVRYLWHYILDYEKAHGGNKSTYWIRFELLWREFFHHIGEDLGSLLFSRNGRLGPADFSPSLTTEKEAVARFTREPLMKAAWRELTTTGFLSNRMRQWFASHWIYGAQLDWLQGAALFERYLIDYDVYSNFGNWQYIAGVGYDPRGGRDFNLKKQLEMYDPQGDYLKRWS